MSTLMQIFAGVVIVLVAEVGGVLMTKDLWIDEWRSR